MNHVWIDAMFECVPTNGLSISNAALLDCWKSRMTSQSFECGNDLFDECRLSLVEQGRVALRRGPGGGTYRVEEIDFEEKCLVLLFDLLPTDGGTISNEVLHDQWNDESSLKFPKRTYEAYRGELIASNKARRIPGRGGPVCRSGDVNLRESMLQLTPINGDSIGNKSLREKWYRKNPKDVLDENRYWEYRSELIDRGDLALGGGRGGSVKRTDQSIVEEEQERVDSGDAVDTKGPKEKDLYAPLLKTIREKWAVHQLGFNNNSEAPNFVITDSSSPGGKNSKGTWSHPDLTMVFADDLLHMGPVLEVITFEVKPLWDINIKGTFETVAHTAIANQSYFFVQCDGIEALLRTKEGERIIDESQRFGVGLVTFGDPEDESTWTVIIKPRWQSPNRLDVHSWLTRAFYCHEDRASLEALVRRVFKRDDGINE